MPRLGVPVIYDPDRENITFDEKITTVAPEAPFLGARKVFVTGPGGLSPGETFMGTIEQATSATSSARRPAARTAPSRASICRAVTRCASPARACRSPMARATRRSA
jgi:hypothetical protein